MNTSPSTRPTTRQLPLFAATLQQPRVPRQLANPRSRWSINLPDDASLHDAIANAPDLEDCWSAVQDLWQRVAQHADVVVGQHDQQWTLSFAPMADTAFNASTVNSFGVVDLFQHEEAISLWAALAQCSSYRWTQGSRSGALVQTIFHDQAGVHLKLVPMAVMQRWRGGAQIVSELECFLGRLTERMREKAQH